ncbi:MAG: PAS domain-containing sensor histidine kinase, partial [Thermomicrobiales bacterium]
AIVRAIVEAHGGTVAIASTVGLGTTVTLQLPLALRASNTPPSGTSTATVPVSARHGDPQPGHVPGD